MALVAKHRHDHMHPRTLKQTARGKKQRGGGMEHFSVVHNSFLVSTLNGRVRV